MANLTTELKGYNFDNGAFEAFNWDVTINDDNGFRVKNDFEAFDFDTIEEVVEHLEMFA